MYTQYFFSKDLYGINYDDIHNRFYESKYYCKFFLLRCDLIFSFIWLFAFRWIWIFKLDS